MTEMTITMTISKSGVTYQFRAQNIFIESFRAAAYCSYPAVVLDPVRLFCDVTPSATPRTWCEVNQ